MDRTLGALLTAALSSPDDVAPRRSLADWLEASAPILADKVRRNCETGHVYHRGYVLTGDGVGDAPSVALLVLQLLPQKVAVEFGCRCAEHVLPAFRRDWPDDERPEQLLNAIRNWLTGSETKKRVRELAWSMADVIDDDAAVPPPGAKWDRRRTMRRYRAVCAANSAVNAAVGVHYPANSDRWCSSLCTCAVDAMSAAEKKAHERTWQQREMVRLIRDQL
jgi:hypothetical protein